MEPQPSLLSAVLDHNQKMGKNHILTRMIIVSSLSPQIIGSKQDLGAHFERLYKGLHGDTETVTGILLVLQSKCIHLIEAIPSVVKWVLQELEKPTLKGMLAETKVVSITNDASYRMFPVWASRVAQPSHLSDNYDADPEETVDLASSVVVKLSKLGHHLSQLEKHELKTELDTIRRTRPELVPQETAVSALLESEDLFTAQDFLSIVYKTTEFEVEDELVWPPQPPLAYLQGLK